MFNKFIFIWLREKNKKIYNHVLNLNELCKYFILLSEYFLKKLVVYDFQITGETVGEVRAVSGMHQRKAEMARQADAFMALPGAPFCTV